MDDLTKKAEEWLAEEYFTPEVADQAELLIKEMQEKLIFTQRQLSEAEAVINDLSGRHGMQTGDMSGNSFEWRTKFVLAERELFEASKDRDEWKEQHYRLLDTIAEYQEKLSEATGDRNKYRKWYIETENQLSEANDKYNRCNEARSMAVKEAVRNKDMWDGSARRVLLLESQLSEAKNEVERFKYMAQQNSTEMCFEEWLDAESASLDTMELMCKGALEKAYNAGVAAERERCAGIAESVDKWLDWESELSDYQAIAAAIRREDGQQ